MLSNFAVEIPDARALMAQPARRAYFLIRQSFRPRKGMSETRLARSRNFCMFAISGDELGGETDGSAHCDLLAEDRAHSRLKSIPTAGSPWPWSGCDKRRQCRVAQKVVVNCLQVSGEIEYTTEPRDDCRQQKQPGESDPSHQCVFVLGLSHLDGADFPVEVRCQ
jgi:hypothetical protein